jgi:hypothetical membrane protein
MKLNATDRKNHGGIVSTAGIFFFVAGFVIFMGIITGEMFYSLDFTTRDNYISELAAALPLGTPTPQPSGTIFNLSMILSGLLIMPAAVLTIMTYRRPLCSVFIFLFGVGLLGVGLFPGYIAPWHGIFAYVIFLSGGIGAVFSFRLVSQPLKYVFMFFGVLSLLLLFFSLRFVPALGVGGVERWVFYPQVFWIMGLGAYLLGRNTQSRYNH